MKNSAIVNRYRQRLISLDSEKEHLPTCLTQKAFRKEFVSSGLSKLIEGLGTSYMSTEQSEKLYTDPEVICFQSQCRFAPA